MLVTAWFTQDCYIVTVTFSVGENPVQAHFKTLEEAAMYINSIIIEYGHEENFFANDDDRSTDGVIVSSKLADNEH